MAGIGAIRPAADLVDRQHEELERQVSPQTTGLTTFLASQPELGTIRASIDGESLTYSFGNAGPAVIQQPAEPSIE